MIEVFIQSFILYFVVIDPIGNTPIFLSVTKLQNEKEKTQTAIESVIVATLILIIFSIIGQLILSYLNISFASFRIAGGIILFLISIEMLFDKRVQRKKRSVSNSGEKVSIFPLAIPILAGPAAITSVIVLASDYKNNFFFQLTSLAGLVLVMLITMFIFLILSKSDKFINKEFTNITSRVIAIILAGLSIQYIIDGLLEIFTIM